MAIDKRSYEAPAVARIGTFEDITQGNVGGATLDQPIPAGTPLNQIPGFIASHTS